jgi:deoxyribodipyrimidine photolyase-related protein
MQRSSYGHIMAARWLFGDQLGPHFSDGQQVYLVENRAAFGRYPIHRQKAHLLLSALRHRATDPKTVLIQANSYAEAHTQMPSGIEVVDPTSFAARDLVRQFADITVLPSRGFLTPQSEFSDWAEGRKRLVMEDWYRHVRVSHDILMVNGEPVGDRWNFDAENREPPPKGVTSLGLPVWTPTEDEIDAQVRADLDAWQEAGAIDCIGRDGPRWFAATRAEAMTALTRFIEDRLPTFGPYEDAMLTDDPVMSHSMLSVPLNLGLLDPMEIVDAALDAYHAGHAPLASVEGLIRQVIGWREFIWHVYWHFGPDYVESSNALDARQPLPSWFATLQADDVDAVCLRTALADVRDRGWSHHIMRLMVLGNWALQRGYEPAQTTAWFQHAFVDGYPWVMAANVVGMALYADGGRMSTKPYASGGAYIKRMSNFCGSCRYRPNVRVGDDACPFTAGYWWFLDRNDAALAGNHRMAQPRAGLKRLADRDELVRAEQERGAQAP